MEHLFAERDDAGHLRRPEKLPNREPDSMRVHQQMGNARLAAAVQRESEAGAGAAHEEESAGAQRSPVLDVVGRGGGAPLDGEVRADMESSLGADLSDVRVHRGGQAAASAESIGARAYTVGNEVVFGDGAYDPGSADGRRTLAHELTHVVQQRSGPVDGTPTGDGVAISDPGDRFEREAVAVAEQVVAGGRDSSSPAGGGGSASAATSPVQRREEEEELQMLQRQEEEEELQMEQGDQ